MKRAALSILCIALVACTGKTAPISSDNAAAVRAAAITAKYRLTRIGTECLYFDTNDEGTAYLVRVREKHSKACGGDPDTSPTVFFLELRKRDGYATTTAYNTNGEFQPLMPGPGG